MEFLTTERRGEKRAEESRERRERNGGKSESELQSTLNISSLPGAQLTSNVINEEGVR
jgi:hypothetical protein